MRASAWARRSRPKEIEFRTNLPKTRSGKIMRRLLKARELGLPEGDLRRWKGRAMTVAATTARLKPHRRASICCTCCARCCASAASRKVRRALQREKIRGFLHLYIGEEAVAVGVMQALAPEDAIVATYREHGHAHGARRRRWTRSWRRCTARRRAAAAGRGGSMHLFDAGTRFYGGNAIVGGGLPLAVGLALADKMAGRGRSPPASSAKARWPKASSTSR